MLELSEFKGDNLGSTRVFIDPAEIMCIREYAYHSFRPLISEITLRTGQEIIVWETVGHVRHLIDKGFINNA